MNFALTGTTNTNLFCKFTFAINIKSGRCAI